MSQSPFNRPSDSEGLGVKINEFEGALCIFTFRSEGETETKKYGMKPYVEADVDCVEGVAEGTVSKMPPQGFGQQPTVLSDRTGQSHTKIRIFQGFLRGSFRGRQPGDLVLGRIVVEGKVTSVSNNDKDLKASYVLQDATEEETAQAVEYLNRKQASKLQAPSTASAPASNLPAEPAF